MVCGAGLFWLTTLTYVYLWPVGMQFVLLAVIMLGWPEKARRPWSFRSLSLAATAAAFGIATCISLATDEREFARLRARFPYESIVKRLPVPHPPNTGKRLPGDADQQMALLEDAVRKSHGQYKFKDRAFLLQQLHEETVNLFVNSSGFGVARLFGRPSESGITYRLRPDALVPQPALSTAPSGASGDRSPGPTVTESEALRLLHREGVMDFVYPVGFGYAKDRSHVAGFQSHRFSSVPGPEEEWGVLRLELVSLLLHDRPVVYVSESLPRMDKLRGAPTRPLDSFEAAALEKLRGGEYLLVADAPD